MVYVPHFEKHWTREERLRGNGTRLGGKEREPNHVRFNMQKTLHCRVMEIHEKYFKERGKVIRFASRKNGTHCNVENIYSSEARAMQKDQSECYYCSPDSR